MINVKGVLEVHNKQCRHCASVTDEGDFVTKRVHCGWCGFNAYAFEWWSPWCGKYSASRILASRVTAPGGSRLVVVQEKGEKEMTIAQQLHNSATHKHGKDQNCPICNPTLTKLKDVLARLQRSARTNDSEPAEDIAAHAVAAEQWRMVRILKDLENEVV